jgi:hypothetical protein
MMLALAATTLVGSSVAVAASAAGFSMKTLVRLLSVGLLLGLALSPAWVQLPSQATVGAPEHETTGQPRQGASDIPADDFDRGTPRRAVEGFRQASRARDYRRAAEYLDLRRFPAEEAKILGPQLARHLKIVLDQQLPIDVNRLSDSPAGYLEDGLPRIWSSWGALTPQGCRSTSGSSGSHGRTASGSGSSRPRA